VLPSMCPVVKRAGCWIAFDCFNGCIDALDKKWLPTPASLPFQNSMLPNEGLISLPHEN